MVKKEKLTNQDRRLILGITILLFCGIFLIGKGFTGMYLIDFEQEYCNTDEDCITGQVCCNFYKEESGVCDEKSNCKAIEHAP